MKNPIEITKSLERFIQDHPEPRTCAFLMMQFGRTDAHESIVGCLRNTVSTYNIKLLRSDDKAYHDDLYWNIMTYIYGCSFGLALFERIESEVFNPNVAFETGYMIALNKPVCLLKDSTIPSLYANMIGRLFLPFDIQNPDKSISSVLIKWLFDKDLIQKSEKQKRSWSKYLPNVSKRDRQILKVVELAHQDLSNDEISQKLEMHIYDVYTICRSHGLPIKRFPEDH